MLTSFLQMMPGGTSTGSYSGSFWLTMIFPSLAVGVVLVLVLALYLRRDDLRVGTISGSFQAQPKAVQARETVSPGTVQNPPKNAVLAEVMKSLAPTLMDDERRVMDELVKAGGEVLQSDLPRMTDFSKATVSKAIHGLEVRGIVVREKHKWTYWCKLNPRLIERTLEEEPGLQENSAISA